MAETRSISFIPSDTLDPNSERGELLPRHYNWGAVAWRNTITCVFVSRRSGRELVLGRLEMPGGQPVLPGHTAPQGPVHAVGIHVPAVATSGAEHGAGQIVLQLRVEFI